MRAIAMVAFVLLASCSANTPNPGVTSSPSSSAVLRFNCQLPVLWSNQDPSVDGKAGFVIFPAGSLSVVPQALPKTMSTPASFSYDRVTRRWLPVSRQAVAPDGLHYAYADYDRAAPGGPITTSSIGRVHVVDVRTSADRVVYSGAPPFAVVDFNAAGLFLTQFSTSIHGSQRRGLYLLDPAGGTPHLVPGSDVALDSAGWEVVSGDTAWATRFSGNGAMWSGNELVRFDIKTGGVVSWLAAPTDRSVYILGFDSGAPLVSSSLSVVTTEQSAKTAVMLMIRPGQSKLLYSIDAHGPGALGVPDAHGLWMGGAGSIWFYQPASGIRPIKVVDDPNTVVDVGGACV